MVRVPPEESKIAGELAALGLDEEDDPAVTSEGMLRAEAGTSLKMGAGGAEAEGTVQPCSGGANAAEAGEREASGEVDGGSALVDATALPFLALDEFFSMIFSLLSLTEFGHRNFSWVCRKERGKEKASISYNFYAA